MALGGGTFTAQNKVLPGAYINFVSTAKAGNLLGTRGTVAIGMNLAYGEQGKVIKIKRENAAKRSLELFGYNLDAPEMLWLREILRNAVEVLVYRLNTGGAKAANTFATAKHTGTRGNSLMVKVKEQLSGKKEVALLLGGKVVDTQVVTNANELKANAFVDWKTGASLAQNEGLALTGGTDGTVNGESHSAFLGALESVGFNALGLMSNDDETKNIYIAYIKRMREEIGLKAQLVVFEKKANYEGVVSVKNDEKLVPWVLGAVGGCEIQNSLTNKVYDGEHSFKADYTHADLESALRDGHFTLHKAGDSVRVLSDINTLTTFTDEKSQDFRENQTIRVLDQMGTDIAKLFNDKYLGKIHNSPSGRTSLWADVVAYNKELGALGAIEEIESSKITVEAGSDKRGVTVVNPVTPVHAMQQLYMTVEVG